MSNFVWLTFRQPLAKIYKIKYYSRLSLYRSISRIEKNCRGKEHVFLALHEQLQQLDEN